MGLTPQGADCSKQLVGNNRPMAPEGPLPRQNIRFADLRERQPISFPSGGRNRRVIHRPAGQLGEVVASHP